MQIPKRITDKIRKKYPDLPARATCKDCVLALLGKNEYSVITTDCGAVTNVKIHSTDTGETIYNKIYNNPGMFFINKGDWNWDVIYGDMYGWLLAYNHIIRSRNRIKTQNEKIS